MIFDMVVTFMRGAKQKEMFETSDLRRRESLHLRSVCPVARQGEGGGGGGGGGRGYCDIFILGILNFNIFGFFKKNEYF